MLGSNEIFLHHEKKTPTQISHVLVDEVQDLSISQYEILKRLGKHITIVGDDDQVCCRFSSNPRVLFITPPKLFNRSKSLVHSS